MKKNQEIRAHAKLKGVNLWEVAEVLGIQDSAFSRKLRKELSATEQTKIISIIDEIARNKQKTATA